MTDLNAELSQMNEICVHFYTLGLKDGINELMRMREEEYINTGRCDLEKLVKKLMRQLGEM